MPDIIFTGIVMPRMDGFSMIEALKKTVMTSGIPIVISSHMGREEDKARADALGVKDFIIRGTTRPIEVLERIDSLFIDAGDNYKLEFNAEALDAKKLAMELRFQENFNCLDCGGKLNLNLKLTNPQDRIFETTFICSQCKSVVK
jgi:DNA-binding response OmpR family regulator